MSLLTLLGLGLYLATQLLVWAYYRRTTTFDGRYQRSNERYVLILTYILSYYCCSMERRLP